MPVRNAAAYLAKTLPALVAESGGAEIIVVDDNSSDDSVSIAREAGARVICLDTHHGAALARNRGVAETRAEVIVFVDADVLVAKNSIEALTRRLLSSDAAAVFGSYDDTPEARTFASQYANLRHHYYHQGADGEARTFWAGFGAIRRQAFEAAAGFDPRYPGVEDIALGYHLSELGYRVILDSSLQVTHLKQWTFWNLVRTDIMMRAAPWSRLRIASPGADSLNVTSCEKARAAASILLFLGAPLALAGVVSWLFVPAALGVVAVANARLGLFFTRKRGFVFAVAATAMHQLYYVYASATFTAISVSHVLRRSSARERVRNKPATGRGQGSAAPSSVAKEAEGLSQESD